MRSQNSDTYTATWEFSEKGVWYESEGGKENAIRIIVDSVSNPHHMTAEAAVTRWKKYYAITMQPLIIDNHNAIYYRGYGEGMLLDNTAHGYTISITSSVINTPEAEKHIRPVLQKMINSLHFMEN